MGNTCLFLILLHYIGSNLKMQPSVKPGHSPDRRTVCICEIQGESTEGKQIITAAV